ncbi:MAG: hypothetical protein KBT72_07360 [Zhongshania sp.]|jgi:hypothetical protein|nr:hypothetical protein [Zhongshania sp.]
MSLLQSLLSRGDWVAVEGGRLLVEAASRIEVPDEWLQAKSDQLLRDIAAESGQTLFAYCGYTTGIYRANQSPGVTLRYSNMLTGEHAHVIFNAELHRGRNTAHGKKGSPLPKGRFRVNRGYSFVRLWQRLGLDLPRRLSDFHDRMGKLKGVVITAKQVDGNRLDKQSIRAFDWAPKTEAVVGVSAAISDKSPTNVRQLPDNAPTILPDKEIVQAQVMRAFQADSSACEKPCVLSNQARAYQAPTYPVPKDVKEQSNEEWMQDYFGVD